MKNMYNIFYNLSPMYIYLFLFSTHFDNKTKVFNNFLTKTFEINNLVCLF